LCASIEASPFEFREILQGLARAFYAGFFGSFVLLSLLLNGRSVISNKEKDDAGVECSSFLAEDEAFFRLHKPDAV
jgi:hypothetical protein